MNNDETIIPASQLSGKVALSRPQSMFKDVQDFHRKFDLQWSDDPQLPPDALMSERLGFIREEYEELILAFEIGDLPAFADALGDLVFVVFGTAVVAGIPMEQVWQEICRANMAKVRGVTKRGFEVDVAKPEGWVPPDIEGVLANHRQGPR